jgi:UDP-glucuronate 4-epimerase
MSRQIRTVVVTGCAGFIGSHLTELLLQEGWHVHGIDNLDDYYPARLKIQNLEPILAHPNFSFEALDLAERPRLETFARRLKPDAVVHLAAVAGVRLSIADPARYVRANVTATQNLLDVWSRPFGIPLVFGSSSSVYGDDTPRPFSEDAPCVRPRSPYAATKRSAELLCEVAHSIHGCPITMLRFFTVYGPRQRPDLAIRKFATAILRDREITVFGDGSMARDFTHVSDIVRGIRCAMDEREGLRTINLGNANPCSVRDLVASLGDLLGKKPRIEHVERPPGEMDITYADVSRASTRWGWRAETQLLDGLRDFCGWLGREEAGGRNP